MPRTPVPIRVERSFLSVPGSNWGMIQKAVASEADAVYLDLEDAVAPNQKEASRPLVVRALRELDWGRKVRCVRINGLDTPWAYRDLVEVVESAGDRLDCIVLPKTNRPEDVAFVDILLTQIELAKGFTRRIGIEAQIETAQGLANIHAIATASERLEALVFGPGDYAASVQMPLTAIGEPDEADALYPGHRWHYAMHRIVVAARAAGLRALDGPYAAHRDTEGFRKACRIARSLGFDGKWCIHPLQVPIANEVFSPPRQEIEWAVRVVQEYERATAQGQGAITIDGRMIDAASVRMAQATVQKARLAGLL
ncbi:MAG: CoA ester lyase [Dehalococcoidia bacterium]|nr:CoA ester lyase [Dehalococcoidia bacterium]MDW8120000.1 CoA ester lyase [Chloroflexota bacterium]